MNGGKAFSPEKEILQFVNQKSGASKGVCVLKLPCRGPYCGSSIPTTSTMKMIGPMLYTNANTFFF